MLSLIPLIKDNTHSVLSSLLMEGGLQAIDKISAHVSNMKFCYQKHPHCVIFSLQPERYSSASKDLAKFISVESEKVAKLFARLLERKYSPEMWHGGSNNLSLNDLLTWPHWPSFIRICSKYSI